MNDILAQIDNWIKIILANPYFGLAGFVIGVIGLIFLIMWPGETEGIVNSIAE